MKLKIILFLVLFTNVTQSGYLPEVLYRCSADLDWEQKGYSLEFSFDNNDQLTLKTFKKKKMLQSCKGKSEIRKNPFQSRSGEMVINWEDLECNEVYTQDLLKVEPEGFFKLSLSHFKSSFISANDQMNTQTCKTKSINDKKLLKWLSKKFP